MRVLNPLRSPASLFIVTCAVVFSAAASCAEDADHFKYDDELSYTATVNKEMTKFESLYRTATSKKITQGEAEQARQNMFKLSRHLLQHINERSASIDLDEGDTLSSAEILLNMRVTGRLLDVLVADALPHEDDWSYVY